MKGEQYGPRDSRSDLAGGGCHAGHAVVAPGAGAECSGSIREKRQAGDFTQSRVLPSALYPTMTIGILASKQNRDGGWPYVRGSSWTEPTAYAVLALLAAGETEPAQRGLRWNSRHRAAGRRLASASWRRPEHVGDRAGGAAASGAAWRECATLAPSPGCWETTGKDPR